jgi:hypothetical protein
LPAAGGPNRRQIDVSGFEQRLDQRRGSLKALYFDGKEQFRSPYNQQQDSRITSIHIAMRLTLRTE